MKKSDEEYKERIEYQEKKYLKNAKNSVFGNYASESAD